MRIIVRLWQLVVCAIHTGTTILLYLSFRHVLVRTATDSITFSIRCPFVLCVYVCVCVCRMVVAVPATEKHSSKRIACFNLIEILREGQKYLTTKKIINPHRRG